MSACDVCGRPILSRGATQCCMRCRMAGAAFATRWSQDLRAAGMTWAQVAEVVGRSINAASSRVSEARRGLR